MSLKVGFLVQQMKNDASTPILLETMNILRGRNVKVEILNPDEYLLNLSFLEVACDLYILKPFVELSLSLASILHDKGAHILNSFPASTEVQDKIRFTSRLHQKGIPTPQSFVTGNLSRIREEVEELPFILKPHRGFCGEGITIFNPSEKPSSHLEGTFILQEFLKSDGEDLKIYVIGNEVYGLKRSPRAKTFDEKAGWPYPLSENLKKIALDCGKLFNLHIYGIDIIETVRGPYVVDINAFPGFIGVPDAPE